MTESLIPRTKITIPPLRATIIDRPRLLNELVAATDERLLLVVAPAGAGKTSLLTQLAHARLTQDQDVAWLSLMPMDADPAVFWLHMLEALSEAGALDDPTRLRHHLGEGGIDDDLIPLFVTSLDTAIGPVTVILDDFQSIDNKTVHDTVDEFISLLPPQIQVVIGSRTEPAISTARLRIRGDLQEVRAADLEFAADEASTFFDSLALSLTDEQVATLHEAAEGWVAGLYIAGISLRSVDDRDRFIREFSGGQRHLVDYLTSEVLDRESPDIRRFLLETSIVEEQHPELCDAITGRSDSATVLRRLASENQFVQVLDEHRRGFRYHRIFADALKELLVQERKGETAALYRRAAEWCLAGGHIAGAIHHQIEGENYEAAADLIVEHWMDFSNKGLHVTVFAFMEALPPAVVSANIELIVRAAWATLNLRDYPECNRWLTLLEETAPDSVTADRYTSPLRSHLARHEGHTGNMLEYGTRAVETQSPEEGVERASSTVTIALGLFWQGHHDKSAVEFRRSIEEGERASETSSIVIGNSYLAYLEARAGNHASALSHIDAVASEVKTPTIERFHLASMAHIAAAEVAMATGRYVQAEQALTKARQLAELGHEPLYQIVELTCSARLAHRHRDDHQARLLLADARRLLAEQPDPGWASDIVSEASRDLRFAPRDALPVDGLPLQPVTPREQAVLRLLPTNLTRAEIASELHISLATVKSHMHSLARKFTVSSRKDIVEQAEQSGQL